MYSIKSKKKLVFSFFMHSLLVFFWVFNTACTQEVNEAQELAPHTGFTSVESDIVPENLKIKSPLQSLSIGYIYAERVRARSAPMVKEGNIVGVLEMNDQVVLLDNKVTGNDEFVKVRVKKSKSVKVDEEVYVSKKYLSKSERILNAKNDKEKLDSQKYFMIQNIATEMARIYRRCLPNEGCINKLVLQTSVIAGEDDEDEDTRTQVGIYKIDHWVKLYEEVTKKNPAWYRPNYPEIPGPGSGPKAWVDKDILPNGQGRTRGAYGWYTAKLTPNAAAQWSHGTVGWGSDKDYYISYRKTLLLDFINLFRAIRSHGCTQFDNESISYIRHIMPAGSTIIKVYAREVLADDLLSNYSAHRPTWDYIMTKTGYGKIDGVTADAQTVLAKGIPESEWIEKGQYSIDQQPSLKTENLYKISNRDFRGVFIVDQGTFNGYQHPKGIKVGGVKDQAFPSYMQNKDYNNPYQ